MTSATLAAAIGLGAGTVVTVICRLLAGQTQRIRRTRTAQCIAGERGLYITGQYWPWQTFGQWLETVHFPDESELVFTFYVQNKHGTCPNTLRVPVPPGQQLVARAIARLLS